MKALALLLTPLVFTLATNEPMVTYKTDNAHSSFTIEGTSTLHDWEMSVEDYTGTIDVDVTADEVSINNLKLNVPVKGLKSGKSPMDNNAHKALKADDHKNISFVFKRAKSVTKSTLGYTEVQAEGALTIAGKTLTVDVPIKVYTKDAGISLKGETSLKMSEFGVEPPTFMFGSVTTGDKITIKFNINYN